MIITFSRNLKHYFNTDTDCTIVCVCSMYCLRLFSELFVFVLCVVCVVLCIVYVCSMYCLCCFMYCLCLFYVSFVFVLTQLLLDIFE